MPFSSISTRSISLASAGLVLGILFLSTSCNTTNTGRSRNPTVAEYLGRTEAAKEERKSARARKRAEKKLERNPELASELDRDLDPELERELERHLAGGDGSRREPDRESKDRAAVKARKEAKDPTNYAQTGRRGVCPKCAALHFGDAFCAICGARLR